MLGCFLGYWASHSAHQSHSLSVGMTSHKWQRQVGRGTASHAKHTGSVGRAWWPTGGHGRLHAAGTVLQSGAVLTTGDA